MTAAAARGAWRVPVALLGALAAVWLAGAAGPARADAITVRAAPHEDYGRMVFNWEIPVRHTAVIEDRTLVVRFGRPVEASFAVVTRTLNRYVSGVRVTDGGTTVRFPLVRDFAVRSFTTGAAVVVDLLDTGPPAPEPAPEPVASAPEPTPAPAPARASASALSPATGGPEVAVRWGEHADYTRVVFDWPRLTDYTISRTGGTLTFGFVAPARIDTAALDAGKPRWVQGARSGSAESGNAVTVLSVPATAPVKHFHAGPKLVVDVFAPTGKPIADVNAEPAPDAAPEPAPEPAPVAPSSGPPAPGGGARPTPLVPPSAAVGAAPTNPGIDAFTLRIDWDEPVAAAVFRRAGGLWLVFDKAAALDPQAVIRAGNGVIRDVRSLPVDDATALWLDLPADMNPELRRDGLAWIFQFRRQDLAANTAIESRPQPDSPVGVRIFLPVPEPGKAIAVRDPVVGDAMIVVPVIPLGHGILQRYEYPQLRLLPTGQGVVVRPLSDGIQVRALREGIEITSTGPLAVSPVSEEVEAMAKLESLRTLTRTLDLEPWVLRLRADFIPRRQELESRLAAAEGPARSQARMDLARFYFANRLMAETLGVLSRAGLDDPAVTETAAYRLLHGGALLMMDRLDEAQADLDHASVAETDEGTFWRAILRAQRGDVTGAAPDLKRVGSIIAPYPKPLKIPLGLVITDAMIHVGDYKTGEHYLELLKLEHPDLDEEAQITFLEGRLAELAGAFDDAVAKWENVMDGTHRPSRAHAAVARTELLLKLGRISRAQAIEEYEKLRFAWRGDEFEFRMLRRLGRLYLLEGDYREGLRTLRQAATHFRIHPEAPQVTQEMADAFADLYLRNKADSLPPVTAIALYEEFKELTPAGEKGDELIRKLADRLVQVDLLDRAAELLDQQVKFRLSGELRARVGARLSLVHILAKEWEAAIEALDISAHTPIPEDLQDQRRHLRAQALFGLERGGEALALLKDDKTLEADLLRAEIYWDGHDWVNAADVLRQLIRTYGVRPGQALDDKEARTVLDLAVALTLSSNERAIQLVQRDFSAQMAQTPYKDAFRLIADPEFRGLIDYRSIPQRVAMAQNFTTFMAAYRDRLKAGGLSAIN